AAVQNVRDRDLLTTNGFWTVFHGILGLGPSVKLVDPVTREKFNAVDYICKGRPLEGLEFIPTEWGLDVRTTGPTGRGQGHQDYFIAEMAVWAWRLRGSSASTARSTRSPTSSITRRCGPASRRTRS